MATTVHEPDCPHVSHPNPDDCVYAFQPCVTCGYLAPSKRTARLAGRAEHRQRIVDNLNTALAEAQAANQTVRAGIIQNMIDRVSLVATDY